METMQVPKDKLSGASGDGEGEGALTVTVKLENEEEEFENNGTMPFLPKPLEDLHQMGPPPFLNKTYEMVEDPETDPIVSWGDKMDSFVVWEPHKFGSNLLPKYFKHSNFSSFIRQLNTYGFRKVHLDRWEFANPGFQKGKKHLLKTIKRRHHGANNNNNNNNHAKLHLEREIELEKLKKEQEALTVEIDDLKQQQHNSDKCLAAMEERVRCVEWKQREFIVLIAKAMRTTPFFQQLIHKYKQKKSLSNGGMLKKQRLPSSEAFEDSFLAKDLTQYGDHHCHQDGTVATATSTGERLKKMSFVSSDILKGLFVDKGMDHVIHKGGVAIESEIHSLLSSPPMDIGYSSLPDQKSGLSSETSSPDMSSGNYLMWEKLMEDDVICEDDEEEALADNKSKFVTELEDLIAKPSNWVPLANVGEVACPIGQ